MRSFKRFIYGIVLKGETSDPSDNIEGSIWSNSTSSRLKSYIEAAARILVTEDQSQTLTNKTIDADSNTISNIDNADIKTGADIDRAKLDAGNAYRVVTNDATGVMVDAAAITANRALISDANGIPTHSTVTAAELAVLSGGGGGTVVTTTATQTIQNKTLDNTNNVTLLDTNFTLQDDGDPTKQAKFQASGISTSTTRTFTFPDADTTLVGTDATQTLSNKTLTTPTIATINGVDTINGAAATTLDIQAASGAGVNIQSGTGAATTIEDLTIDNNTISNASGNIALNPNNGTGSVTNSGRLINDDHIAVTGATNSASGADNDITLSNKGFVKLTNAGLTSIRSFDSGVDGYELTLANETGVTFLLKNEDAGATAANRILTGTGTDLTFPVNAALSLVYDGTSSRWRVVGGTGSGSSTLAITTQSGTNYTAVLTDNVILYTAGAADRTLTLYAASGNSGRSLVIKKVDAGVGKIIIDANSSETIDGSLTFELVSQYETVTIVCDNSNWHVI